MRLQFGVKRAVKSWLFICYFLVSQATPVFLSAQHFDHQTIASFLNKIASTEAEEWKDLKENLLLTYPGITRDSSIKSALDRLRSYVLESEDKRLIRLFQRAVRNHDALSNEKMEPVTTYYKHYESPPFLIPAIDLKIDVLEDAVKVTTHLTVEKKSMDQALILDGKEHRVEAVFVNGQQLPREQYRVTPHELIVLDLPHESTFTVTICSSINPFANDSLEGMYRCGKWLTTQCESEGARRIFYTLDRPDVLSRITTTITADKEKYPYRLSNGNLIDEKELADGRVSITWDDPFPKPCYLFACVLGKFSRLTSNFTTRSGKEVELEIYLDPGREERGVYALYALKKAMEFDELYFDREYDLSSLKMVGIPNFNSGAMENKGLMIFNDIRLLVDAKSGTDRSFREVAHVIAHEYFHNWSGNRVTVRNWFEIALKEAFTDLRAMYFSEWLFGSAFIRPKAVLALREHQFPEECSAKGHSLIIESYVDAHSIYDNTTYIKGREVFRTLKNYVDFLVPDGFREMQNRYFEQYDGQAVTFRELLAAGNEILRPIGQDLSFFERWFHQTGTPVVKVRMEYKAQEGVAEFFIEQLCPHLKTGEEQLPFQIPFSIELLDKEGKVIQPLSPFILDERSLVYRFAVSQEPIPIFMHGYSAPVILEYSYTLEELGCILKYSSDPFCRWEAAQNYSIEAFKEMCKRIESNPLLEQDAQNGKLPFADLHQVYRDAIESSLLSPLAKAQILEIPSVRTLSQVMNNFDFAYMDRLRNLYIEQLALVCKESLISLLEAFPDPDYYEPVAEQMEIRELRYAVLFLLAKVEPCFHEKIYLQYQAAKNFDNTISAFNLCLNMGDCYRNGVIEDFYQQWREDKAIFNYWLSSQASSPKCTVSDLRRIEAIEGYDPKNPNHIRSLLRSFIANLGAYHDSKGEGYHYLVQKIIEIGAFNPQVAHNYLAVPAFLDFEKLPPDQQSLMAEALKRLKGEDVPPQTRDLVTQMLNRISKAEGTVL